MQTTNPLFDDLARLATGALGAIQGLVTESEQLVRQRVERMMSEMNLVGREEFDAVKAMAAAARAENERLASRVAALEQALAQSGQPDQPPPRRPRRPAAQFD